MPQVTPEQLQAQVARLRATVLPWDVELDPGVPARTPTLVLSGRSAPLYDEVATALVALGADLRELVGTGHRPHDHPDANQIMIDFWDAHEHP